MKRILVLGSSGSGKSTFASALGEKLAIEVIHLDSHYWKPNWTNTPADEWRQTLKNLLKHEYWIMDGNYINSLELRLSHADTVFFLDFNRFVCLIRCFKRFHLFRGRNRPELAHGCNEKIDWDFFLWIWKYPQDIKPKIMSILQEHPQINVIHLKGKRQVDDYLNHTD